MAARYANISSTLTGSTSLQFAIMLLNNANLTPDTFNTLIYQLTSTDKKGSPNHDVVIVLAEGEKCELMDAELSSI